MSALTPSAVEPLLRGRFGRPYIHVRECPSTQDLLRGTTFPEGTVAVAEHQTAGRGRSGHTWEDASGAGLLLSLLLRPPPGTRPLPQLSLVVALATAEAVEAATGREAGLKWPNDVLLEGRKVAGILLERAEAEVVCGVGVNVNQERGALPETAKVEPTSLRLATGAEHDRAPLLADLLVGVERHYERWLADGLAPLLPELERRDGLRGRRVGVGAVRGVAAGLDAEGRLLVDTGAGAPVAVESGEVELP